MATELHTFMDLFDSSFVSDGETTKLEKIVIPMIQRDYAQGRPENDITRIRTRFLDKLHEAVTDAGKHITLDFIYGDVKNGIMTPLDGQQRLTTLYLLHWYAAKKEGIAEPEYAFLKNFNYKTRFSARHFCIRLIDYTPSAFDQLLSADIINQSWFPLDWKKDPTISSMLNMIDAINGAFKDTTDIWGSLKAGCINFYFLPVRDMGLTDELYIKMNSRGKPLTQFEHFKAELEHNLRLVDEKLAKRIIREIDIEWTDVLWRYRGDDNIIDDEFLRYFKFVCDIIAYRNNKTPQEYNDEDEFDLLKRYFSASNPNTKANAELLECYFNCWQNIKDGDPEAFFNRFIAKSHEPGKITIENRYDINLFHDCLRNYSDTSGRRRTFPLNRIALLYAFVVYLQNMETVTEEQFARRIRIVNNLLLNSEDELSDSEARASGNRMPANLRQIEHIILTGTIDESIEKNLSPAQLEEEIKKIEWVQSNPEKAETLFELEDHTLLQGSIEIIGLDNFDLFPRFAELYDCDWDKVDCALMTFDFYPQLESNKWRYQFGSGSRANIRAWRDLFHTSRNLDVEKTKKCLIELLSKFEHPANDDLDALAADFLAHCETAKRYPWRYYYIKYKEFRPGSYGKYAKYGKADEMYMIAVMRTRMMVSESSYMPYLMVADKNNVSWEGCGQRLDYPGACVFCENQAFVAKNPYNKEEIVRVDIDQDSDGFDTEDRIVKLCDFLAANESLFQTQAVNPEPEPEVTPTE